MRNHLPSLERLIDREVKIFTSITQFIMDITSSYRKESGVYYYHHEGDYFRCNFQSVRKHINLTEEMVQCFSVRIPTLEINHSLAAAIGIFQNVEHAVVLNEQKIPLGIVDANQVCSEIYSSYSYLKSYFDAMIDTMDASISMIDDLEQTVVWTSGAEQIFSIKKEDILGKPMTDFFRESMLKCRESLHTGRSFWRYQHQPRSDLFVLINSQPIYLDGEIVGAVSSEVDVTSHVQLHRQLYEANQKITDLENKMQHLHYESDPFLMISGKSKPLGDVKDKIRKISSTEATILIYGETGVGKELFAKSIHQIREPKNAPFIAINCGAISPTLVESELFGYEKGAFSGALNKGKAGKIELAKGGTLFLDEIGDLPLEMQVKFLRVLQENYYFPVGGTKELQVNCRVVAATNKNLDKLVREGKFREDLFYRLNSIPLTIPPLRERKDDIIDIVHLYLYELSSKYQRQIEAVSPEAMQWLMNYSWPGNIRELKNVIEHVVVFSSGDVVLTSDLPDRIKQPTAMNSENTPSLNHHPTLHLKEEMDIHEKSVIRKVLAKENGDKDIAAKTLGVSRATLYNKLNKHNLR